MNNKISIIIPVYNSEKFLSKCLDSIKNQTYKKFEVLCINDGSTDNSLEILNKYSKSDNRFKIINKKNEGVSIARNLGIKKAVGQYILFVDADDYLNLNALEEMVNLIDKYKTDFVRCSYKVINHNSYEKKIKYNGLYTLNKNLRDELIKDILKQEFGTYLWLLIINKDFIVNNKIYFEDELYVHQDLEFYINLFKHAKNIYFSNIHTYNYLINENGSKSYKNTERNIISNINLSKILKSKLDNSFYEYINELSAVLILPSLYFLYKNDKAAVKNIYYKLINNSDFHNILANLPKKIDKYLLINYIGIYIAKKKYNYKLFKLFYFNIYTLTEYLRKLKKDIFKHH